MSRILKIAITVLGTSLVLVGAIVVYRETDLLTGSLVLLAGLMIGALLARRAAVREERAGMADWEGETIASAEAAHDLFGDWSLTSPTQKGSEPTPSTAPKMSAAPSVAPPVPTQNNGGNASPMPLGAEVPEPDDPSVAVSRPLRGPADEPQDTETLVASLYSNEPAPEPEVQDPDPDPFGIDSFISAPPTPTPEPAMAGAGLIDQHSPIDWTGQGGRVDERVRSSDDILRASEATALPSEGAVGGSELARLLAKVEERLRDY